MSSIAVGAWPARSNARGNPFNALLADAVEQHGAEVSAYSAWRAVGRRFDIIHVHWPEWVLDGRPSVRRWVRSLQLLAALAVARQRGSRVVWSVHNLGSHEGGGRRGARWRAFCRLVDGFVALSPSGEMAARAAFPGLANTPAFVIPHGHYRGQYPDPPARDRARARLGLESGHRVVLSFGHLRSYKRPIEMVRAFRAHPDERVHLIVAGRPIDHEMATAVRRAAADDPRIVLRLGFAEPEEVSTLFAAADLCVLPYTADAQNSGAALLALSFGCPVLTPPTGAFGDLADMVEPGWVHLAPDPLHVEAIDAALDAAEALPEEPPALARFGWDEIGAQTVRAYRAVLDGA